MLQKLNAPQIALNKRNCSPLATPKALCFGNAPQEAPFKTANEQRQESRHAGFRKGLLVSCSLATAFFTFLIGDALLTSAKVGTELINQSRLQHEGVLLKRELIQHSLGLEGMEIEKKPAKPFRRSMPNPLRPQPDKTFSI